MEINIQDPLGDGNEVIMFVDDDDKSVHCIPVQAIASWGELLGITDQDEIIETILNFEETPGENPWGPLYDALQENLDELSKAGVPAEFMHDLVDPTLPSPIPGPEAQKKLVNVRKAARTKMGKRMKKKPKKVSEFRQKLHQQLDGRATRIEQNRTKFLDENSPRYLVEKKQKREVLPETAPAPAPGTVGDLQIHLTTIDPSNI